ncbi:MAG: GDSL-type esterase/lipase family protein, partial [Armatimonadota bacterium]|nr:GDSL-type esterase/lipase family protein [Armatimonadota bacterium]
GQAWLDEITLTVDEAAAQAARLVTDAAPLPVEVAPDDPNIRYVGRFDRGDKAGPRCAWSASTVAFKFQGTAANVKIKDGNQNRWQVEIDGKPTVTLQMREGTHLYSVATDLAAGEHTVRLVKATEAFCGASQFLGFQMSEGGKLLPPPAPARRLEVIGDSISAGYGNEAASKEEHFTPKTENAYFTYGAMAARQLDADYMCIAWSGKKMWPNNTIPELYDRTLPLDAGSKWDFSQWIPDVVLINLGTNDFGKENPDEAGWTDAYKAFIGRLRQHYPAAEIYCATSPMMGDWGANKARTTHRRYLDKIVTDLKAAGDAKVRIIEFPTQDPKNGIGADWHPNIKTHEIMAANLVQTLANDLGWKPVPAQ